jgi:hypothetical protein
MTSNLPSQFAANVLATDHSLPHQTRATACLEVIFASPRSDNTGADILQIRGSCTRPEQAIV